MLDRRSFCLGMLSLPTLMSASPLRAQRAGPAPNAPAVWGSTRKIRLILHDPLEHPFYWWPRTLLSYPIEFQSPIELDRVALKLSDTGEQIPIQFSDVVRNHAGIHSATLHFFSDLPSGGHREFVLTASDSPVASSSQVHEAREGDTIVLDSGVMRVRIPATQDIHGDAPGPILQVSRGGAWVGSSKFEVAGDRITRINAKRVAEGPLFITYELTYDIEGGSEYIARVGCEAGHDFVRFQENMERMQPGVRGVFTSTWSGFGVTHRQAPNHPYPTSGKIRSYDDYPWERIDELWPLYPEALPEGELPFNLGFYQTWTAFRTGTFANFWDQNSGDALGVFIDKVDDWRDHEYANHVESPALEVRYYYQDRELSWKWPIVRGSRSTCIAYYDHVKDKEAMHLLEQAAQGVQQNSVNYKVGLIFGSHVLLLQNRFGTLDLNRVKDWVLDYPESLRRPPVIFSTGMIKDANELEQRVMAGPFVCTLPINGTRENGGAGPIPGKSIVNFSPVPSRQVQGWWVDGFNRCSSTMSDRQRRRLTAMYLFMAYVCAGDDFMPLVPMLSGHPNFLADVKGVPAAMSFLFPDHPMASPWADMWEKCVEINTRYNTRPDVETWDARGGRWTENLGTYVWAFLRPSLRTDFLLRQYDKVERFISPQLAEMADWLVNALSAPFNGETEAAYRALQSLDDGHEWGALAPGKGPRRVHPPQGAHSERRVPPRSLWYLGTCLQRYAPLQAEYAMWAARPTNQDMETALGSSGPWDAMYRTPDNLGTNPHLRSRKYTGYGIVLRSAVDTPEELSIHLQQIDHGPNYRWGVAGEGGCGVIYFFAAGKSYSFNGSEDVGDRDDQDTDFCTNFAVFKDGEFRSIGENVLSRPFYDLGEGQFAEIVPRQEPGAYSAPEYISRSILLAGHDYFVLCDNVLHQQIAHRLSWFVRRGSELPTIKTVRGVTKAKESQRTEIQTAATTGVWFDGLGDSMAVVSYRKDIEVKATQYGCRVSADDIDDLVFRNPETIHFDEGATIFDGMSGLIRRRKDCCEFALFHGARIGVQGITFSTADADLGIGGSLRNGQAPRGEYFAPNPSSVKIAMPSLSNKMMFYVDGEAREGNREPGVLVVDLEAGKHHWELTDKLPTPSAPRIVRTENRSGGARIIAEPVGGATQYRFELSKDAGATWSTIGLKNEPEIIASGLADGQKFHVRAVATNPEWESLPGAEYPLYVTKEPPPPPDGLRVELANGVAALSWGEVLGVSEFRLYGRPAGDNNFSLFYRGLDRVYVDKRHDIQAASPNPNDPGGKTHVEIVEYYVTAVNGNGEGARSRIADTNPNSWRNWDPKPGEPFRRDFADVSPSTSIKVHADWPHYYPR
jgi:hypothetical protein